MTAVTIAEGLTIILGLIMTLVKPIREKITHSKERAEQMQKNFDSLDGKITKVQSEQVKSEKDALRTQLLVMFADYSEDKSQILELAHRYFAELDGDWYLTPIFCKWLEDNSIGKPEWFRG